jgi:hypothetical protein
MAKRIIAFLLLLSLPSHAGQLVPKWSLEKEMFHKTMGTAERLYGIEYIHELGDHMIVRADFGGWIAREKGRRSGLYGSPSWGFRIKPFKYLMGEALVGPGWIQHPDKINGSHFQIFHSLNAGFVESGWSIGLGFTHISCANFCSPNRGRDFFGMRFLIDL